MREPFILVRMRALSWLRSQAGRPLPTPAAEIPADNKNDSQGLHPLFDPTNYPIRANNGRDLGAGYLRGWGLEFDGLFETHIKRDPLYQRAREYSARRGTLLPEHKL